MAGKTFRTSEVAHMAGMTKDGVHKARKRGKFPHTKTVTLYGGATEYRYTRHDVNEFLWVEKSIKLAEVE